MKLAAPLRRCRRCQKMRNEKSFWVMRDGRPLNTAICTNCIATEARAEHERSKSRKRVR